MLAFPPFRLDRDEGRLWKGDALLVLRRKPFAILCYLAEHPQKLVTHDELLAHVWRGAVVSDSAMRSHLHELRQVLGEGVIETVIGRGYRFVAPLGDDRTTPAPTAIDDHDPLVVGREEQLTTLRKALDRALGGHRQLCFVTGKPGIGKSTLVRTFLGGLDPQAVLVARGACLEQHGTPEPYLPIIEALGALTRSSRGTKTVATLVRYAPTFVAQLPQLIGDDQVADVMRRAMGGNESRQLRELCEALETIATQDPLVLVLEDLQWSDVATIDLLTLLSQRQERAKLLVIGTSRHAEIQSAEHPLNRVMRSLVTRSAAIAIQVPKVGIDAVQRFIDQRFVGHAFPAALTELVAKVCGGTPLFMVALLDELAGRGMLSQQDGHWTLTVSIDDVQRHRPASIKQLIDMQIDRLTIAEQRVLEAASVVGAEFSTHLVAAALELPVEDVDDLCDGLVRRSLFLHVEPEDRYGVNHALVQEVCIERNSPARRQRWHRLVADALQRDPRADELPHLLAKHFDAAGDPARAVPAYAEAARLAGLRNATSDSVALCARALDLLPRMVGSRERDLLELEILGTMCRQVSSNTFSAAFAGREPLSVYTRAIEIARTLGEPSGVYRAIMQLCNYNMIIAEYDRCAALTAELEQIEQAHALDPSLHHSGIFARAYIAFYRADLETALRLFERLCPAAGVASEFADNIGGRVVAMGHLACARWVVGDAERALDEASDTIKLGANVNVPVLIALGHVVRARLRFLRRDPLPVLEEEAPVAMRETSCDVGLWHEASTYWLWTRAQRAPLSLSEIAPMLDAFHQRFLGVCTGSTWVALVLIDVLRISGHVNEARQLTDEAIAFARSHNECVYLPELLRVRGEQTQGKDPAAAARDYREAIALAQTSGAKTLELRATDNLTQLLRIPSKGRPATRRRAADPE